MIGGRTGCFWLCGGRCWYACFLHMARSCCLMLLEGLHIHLHTYRIRDVRLCASMCQREGVVNCLYVTSVVTAGLLNCVLGRGRKGTLRSRLQSAKTYAVSIYLSGRVAPCLNLWTLRNGRTLQRQWTHTWNSTIGNQ